MGVWSRAVGRVCFSGVSKGCFLYNINRARQEPLDHHLDHELSLTIK